MQLIQQRLVPTQPQHEYTPRDPEGVRAMIYGLHLRGYVKWVNLDLVERGRYLSLIEDFIDAFNAKQVSNILYALGCIGVSWGDLTQKIQWQLPAAIMRNGRGFISQGIAMTISALAKMGLKFRFPLSPSQDVCLTAFFTGEKQSRSSLLTPAFRDALFVVIAMTAERLDQQGIANILWALATMGVVWKIDISAEMQQKLFQAVLCQAKGFNPQNVSNVLWAFAKMALSWQDLPEALHECLFVSVLNMADQLNPQNLSNTLSAFAKMTLKWIDFPQVLQSALFKAILMNASSVDENTGALSMRMSAQNSSIMLWALAKMKLTWQALPDHPFQEKLLMTITGNLSQFNAQNIANTLQSFAAMGLCWEDLKQENLRSVLSDASVRKCAYFQVDLEQAIFRNRTFFTAQGIGIILVAFANMKRRWHDLTPVFRAALWAIISSHLELIHQGTSVFCRPFDSQGIANTLWALAKMGFCFRDFPEWVDLKQKLFIVILKNAGQFKAQEVSNVLWAFATMGFVWQHLNLLQGLQTALFEAVLANLPQDGEVACDRFNAQGIANTLWALGRMELKWADLTPALQQGFFKAISISATKTKLSIDPFSAAEIAMTFEALAKMEFNFDALSRSFQDNLFSVIVMHAEVSNELSMGSTRFNSQGVSNILWALATMRFSWEQLPDEVQRKLIYAISQTLGEFKPQEIANTLWSLFVMDVCSKSHVMPAGFLSTLRDRAILLRTHADLLSVETLSELLLSLEYFWPEEEALISFSSAYEKKSAEDIAWNLMHSKMNQEVDRRLNKMGVVGKREHLMGYSLDAFSGSSSFGRVIIPLPLDFAFPDCRVGIQIDDPKHTQDVRMRHLDIAHNVLFLKLSEKTGWKIIRIPIVHHSYDDVIEVIQKAIQAARDQLIQSDFISQSSDSTGSTTQSIIGTVTEITEERNFEKRKKRTRHHRSQVKKVSGEDENKALDQTSVGTRFSYTLALSCISYVGSFFGRSVKWLMSAQPPEVEASYQSVPRASSI